MTADDRNLPCSQPTSRSPPYLELERQLQPRQQDLRGMLEIVGLGHVYDDGTRALSGGRRLTHSGSTRAKPTPPIRLKYESRAKS